VAAFGPGLFPVKDKQITLNPQTAAS